MNLARLGSAVGEHWYTNSAPAILLAGNGDARLGSALLAATSPRCGIVDNLRRAIRRASPLPAHWGNIERALRGEPLRGLKVRAFAGALAGDTDAVPIDVWMLRAFDFSHRPSGRDIQDLQCRIRRAAKRAQRTPRDHAACIWCGIILVHGRVPLHYGHALTRITTTQEELWNPCECPMPIPASSPPSRPEPVLAPVPA